MVGPAGDFSLVRLAMQAGARDFFTLPVAEEDLTGALERIARDMQAESVQKSADLTVVINAKGRFISCTAKVVWSDTSIKASPNKPVGVGVRFTKMMLNDRSFLHGEISRRL